jgi:hypothetical protein
LNDRASGRVRLRRRSWYRRRLKVQRTLAGAVLTAIFVAACWQSAARFSRSTSHSASHGWASALSSRTDIHRDLAWTLPHHNKRQYLSRIPSVYPYSVVPGGVPDAESLRRASAQDRAVSRHYAHFDYSKAHLIRVTEPREVYVSYRIRDTIFWTRKKILLHAGEALLTDGKIMARAKCGNQVSDTAQPEVSDQEPEQDILEQPVALEPLGPSLPLRPQFKMPNLPAGPPMAPPLYAGGFSFPLVPVAGAPARVCRFNDGAIDKHCRPHHKGPATPEPSAFILLASGMTILWWRYRKSRLAVAQ